MSCAAAGRPKPRASPQSAASAAHHQRTLSSSSSGSASHGHHRSPSSSAKPRPPPAAKNALRRLSLPLAPPPPEVLNAKATKIQAAWRGHRVRVRMARARRTLAETVQREKVVLEDGIIDEALDVSWIDCVPDDLSDIEGGADDDYACAPGEHLSVPGGFNFLLRTRSVNDIEAPREATHAPIPHPRSPQPVSGSSLLDDDDYLSPPPVRRQMPHVVPSAHPGMPPAHAKEEEEEEGDWPVAESTRLLMRRASKRREDACEKQARSRAPPPKQRAPSHAPPAAAAAAPAARSSTRTPAPRRAPPEITRGSGSGTGPRSPPSGAQTPRGASRESGRVGSSGSSTGARSPPARAPTPRRAPQSLGGSSGSSTELVLSSGGGSASAHSPSARTLTPRRAPPELALGSVGGSSSSSSTEARRSPRSAHEAAPETRTPPTAARSVPVAAHRASPAPAASIPPSRSSDSLLAAMAEEQQQQQHTPLSAQLRGRSEAQLGGVAQGEGMRAQRHSFASLYAAQARVTGLLPRGRGAIILQNSVLTIACDRILAPQYWDAILGALEGCDDVCELRLERRSGTTGRCTPFRMALAASSFHPTDVETPALSSRLFRSAARSFAPRGPLRRLVFVSVRPTAEALHAVAAAAERGSELECVRVQACAAFGDAEVVASEPSWRALVRSGVRELEISRCSLGDPAARVLGRAVAEESQGTWEQSLRAELHQGEQPRGLRVLDLSCNSITGRGALALAKGLAAGAVSLVTLDLSGCFVDDRSARMVHEALRDLREVRTISTAPRQVLSSAGTRRRTMSAVGHATITDDDVELLLSGGTLPPRPHTFSIPMSAPSNEPMGHWYEAVASSKAQHFGASVSKSAALEELRKNNLDVLSTMRSLRRVASSGKCSVSVDDPQAPSTTSAGSGLSSDVVWAIHLHFGGRFSRSEIAELLRKSGDVLKCMKELRDTAAMLPMASKL
eukprot:m51a1_g12413 hypothetical protein (963) ;mRNA; f:728006-731681